MRTGRALRQTRDMNSTFLSYCLMLVQEDKQFYAVSGPVRHADLLKLIASLQEADIIVVRDRQFPPDRLWLFEGTPEELGFAS